MGCNYYQRRKRCEKCGESGEKKHIGKSSHGWQFHFRGYRDEELVSYKDWLEDLEDENKEIIDENERLMLLEEFKEMVEKKKDDLNHCNVVLNCPMTLKEKEYCLKRPYIPDGGVSLRTWKDNDGNAFTDCEFS